MGTDSDAGTRAALTTLRVMETVSDLQPAGVSVIARAADIPKSSAQRCLRTLREAGWVALAPSDRTRWVLTGKALTIGLRASVHVGMREAARGAMERLRDQTGETIHLSSFIGGTTRAHESLVIVDRMDSTQPVRTWVQLGTAAPLHASCSGRTILAQLPEDEVRALLQVPLEKYAENTLATVDDVIADLRLVRERGYATVENGWRVGVGAVAAALLDGRGRPVGALAISMPVQRYDSERAKEFGPRVVAAASEVSEALDTAR